MPGCSFSLSSTLYSSSTALPNFCILQTRYPLDQPLTNFAQPLSAAILASYSVKVSMPLGTPFHWRPCSSMRRARISIARFHEGSSIMPSCHARTWGNPSQTSSHEQVKTSLRRKFQGTKAISAKVILLPTSHCASPGLLARTPSRTPRTRLISLTYLSSADGSFSGCKC